MAGNGSGNKPIVALLAVFVVLFILFRAFQSPVAVSPSEGSQAPANSDGDQR